MSVTPGGYGVDGWRQCAKSRMQVDIGSSRKCIASWEGAAFLLSCLYDVSRMVGCGEVANFHGRLSEARWIIWKLAFRYPVKISVVDHSGHHTLKSPRDPTF